jgi:transposase
MKKYRFFVGIDVSAKTLDVVYGRCIYKTKHIVFSNDAKGIGALIDLVYKQHSKPEQILVCCEHTGCYMDKLAYALQPTGITLWAVSPLLMSNYAIELNRFKTDKADAKKIFQYALMHQQLVVPYSRPADDALFIRELFLLRKQIMQDRKQWQCRMHAASHKAVPNAYEFIIAQQMIAFCTRIIKDLEKQLQQFIRSNKQIQSIYTILTSMPGIGPVIAQHLLAVTHCFKRFANHKQLAAYIGTAPYPRNSGTTLKKKARTSKQAYRPLKADLHQGILSVTKPGRIFYQYYQHLQQMKVPKLQILNNIKNMMLKIIFTLVNNHTPFDEQLFLNNKKSFQKCLVVT